MIWVFKTSVRDHSDADKISSTLDELIRPHGRWNFDLDDCDKILRVETKILHAEEIISAMKNAGFHCEELPD